MVGGACVAGGHAWQGVCGRGHVWQGGMCGDGDAWGACIVGGCGGGHAGWGGASVARETATAAEGTYPTGMHPCYYCNA